MEAWIKKIIKNRSQSKNLGEGMSPEDIWYDASEKKTYEPFWSSTLTATLGVGKKIQRKESRSGSGTPIPLENRDVVALAAENNFPVLDFTASEQRIKVDLMKALDEKIFHLGESIVEKISAQFKTSEPGPSASKVCCY